MKKYKVIAKDNLEAPPHTWTKGLDYEVIEEDNKDYFTISSNEGAVNYFNSVKDITLENFDELEVGNLSRARELQIIKSALELDIVSQKECIEELKSKGKDFHPWVQWLDDSEKIHKKISIEYMNEMAKEKSL
ncbi:hypothetical protein NUG13_12225 [Bacillus subtilis]|uniref:Uncharacterized protein n=1 Tax=Bacillus phage FADO TaxID=2917160 RepID=A0AAE9GC26_9CAUD|nr:MULTISPECIES: hypothetical protein [Bacillus subtilis group]YP_010740072.1 hypothetical protein P9294_gp055 [Bacillus phage FADO]MCR4362096.1 hypothetical protein [Bacillus subtilis]UNY48770.1 hypothetical protein fado_55 [Bacillus phage FADO]UQB84292.1 hypothetical protein KMZ31_19410 [Bacillus amyloliquefaciens]